MRLGLPFVVCALLAASADGSGLDLKQRSYSASRQFVVYSSDAPLRSQVASFAESLKNSVMRLLDTTERQPSAIVITLDRAAGAASNQSSADFNVAQVENSFKIEIDVRIGDNPAAIDLQKQIVRAVLIEYAYHENPAAIRPGETFADPPWWLVHGILRVIQKNESGVDANLFRQIVNVNKLPPIEAFLVARPDVSGAAGIAIDEGCAMCLVQALLDQPGGHQNLARYIKHLSARSPDPAASLLRDFPALSSEQSLQKWWTLNLARYSAADRYEGLSPEETDAQLAALLKVEVDLGKASGKKVFAVADFDEYLKAPASRAALIERAQEVTALSSRANALFRPVLVEYEAIFVALARGKAHGVKERLARIEHYREIVLRRTSDVADYLNWYEATQMRTPSDAFDGYLQTANEFAHRVKHNDPVSRYLDGIASEF